MQEAETTAVRSAGRGECREASFRKFIKGLRARQSLNAEEIQELADALSRLWRGNDVLFAARIHRARKMLDSMLDGVETEVITTGVITSPETEATEKGGKKIPPSPPIRKDPKRNPPIARACAREEEFADRLFLEFWAKYPKECPRKVGKKKCRAKYALLMRNANLHREKIMKALKIKDRMYFYMLAALHKNLV